MEVDADADWRECLAAVCRAERNMMVEHPFMFTLAQQFDDWQMRCAELLQLILSDAFERKTESAFKDDRLPDIKKHLVV